MFYLAGSLRLAGRPRLERGGHPFVCSPSPAACSGSRIAEPRLLTANGRSRISQVCQPLPCSPPTTGTDAVITRRGFHFEEDYQGFSWFHRRLRLRGCVHSYRFPVFKSALRRKRRTGCTCVNLLLCVMRHRSNWLKLAPPALPAGITAERECLSSAMFHPWPSQTYAQYFS